MKATRRSFIGGALALLTGAVVARPVIEKVAGTYDPDQCAAWSELSTLIDPAVGDSLQTRSPISEYNRRMARARNLKVDDIILDAYQSPSIIRLAKPAQRTLNKQYRDYIKRVER